MLLRQLFSSLPGLTTLETDPNSDWLMRRVYFGLVHLFADLYFAESDSDFLFDSGQRELMAQRELTALRAALDL